MTELQDHIARMRQQAGLPEDATTQDMALHSRKQFAETVNNPNRRQVRFIPRPEDGADNAGIVEVRRSVDNLDHGTASVREDGTEFLKDQFRRELTLMLSNELMQAGWVNIEIRNGEAIATLRVIAPIKGMPDA